MFVPKGEERSVEGDGARTVDVDGLAQVGGGGAEDHVKQVLHARAQFADFVVIVVFVGPQVARHAVGFNALGAQQRDGAGEVETLSDHHAALYAKNLGGAHGPYRQSGRTLVYEEALRGNFRLLLTPTRPVPRKWFGELKGKRVLALASGGIAGTVLHAVRFSRKFTGESGEGYFFLTDREFAALDRGFGSSEFRLMSCPVAEVSIRRRKVEGNNVSAEVALPDGTVLAGCASFSEGDALEIAEAFGCRAVRYRGEDRYSFLPAGAGKEEAVRALAKLLKIPLSRAAAFGDDTGDIGMLKACGLGIAVADAAREVKAAADFVCGACPEDGVAKWVEAYLSGKPIHVVS